jgi:hypothetical protein
MTCADLDILLCDYVDETLHGEPRAALERHLAECAGCAQLERDLREAMDLVARSAVVEAPPELMTRIVFELGVEKDKSRVKKLPSPLRRMTAKWLDPILQPRFAMGMAMTVLSFAMLGRYAGIEVRQLRPSDLDPVKVWLATEDRVVRTWERGVKYYENLRLVYEIQTRLKEWSEQAADDPGAASTKTGEKTR